MPSKSLQYSFRVTEGDQKMRTGYLGALIIFLCPMIIMWLHQKHQLSITLNHLLIIWIFSLSFILIVVDYYAHKQKLVLKRKTLPQSITSRFQQALYRWMSWNFILIGALLIYVATSMCSLGFYGIFWDFFKLAFSAWLLFGLPYYLLCLKYHYGYQWDKSCPAILLLCMMRRIYYACFQKSKKKYHVSFLKLLWHNKNLRTAWLGLIVKLFFIPLMLVLFFYNAKSAYLALEMILTKYATENASMNLYRWADLFYPLLYGLLMMIDVTLAFIGYCISTRILDNTNRSVDKTGLGWLSCLICYYPWSKVLYWFLRLPSENLVSMPDSYLKLILMSLVILFIAIYVWATLAFGLKFSNLTHRGIFTKGPYRFCRHPAYSAKVTSWWVEHLPKLTSITPFVALLGMTLVYYVRATTEERHLESVNNDYDAYKNYVKYRFIPGVI